MSADPADPAAADVAPAPDAPDAPTPPRRRRKFLRPLLFLLVLAAIAVAKDRQNAAQFAHELTLPQRTRAHVDRYDRIRRQFGPLLADHVGSDLATLRAAVDPAGKAAGYPGWTV